MKAIWAAQYPACVANYQEGCSETFIHTLNYTQVSVAAVMLHSCWRSSRLCVRVLIYTWLESCLSTSCMMLCRGHHAAACAGRLHLGVSVKSKSWLHLMVLFCFQRTLAWQAANSCCLPCLSDHLSCQPALVVMLQVAGLFAGMVSLGFAVDRIGRKIGSIFTAVVMIIGESLEAPGDSSPP